ncbi:hypothetical protein AB1Y20_013049 [Prymnesium parvum]|uniref:PPPDE domain-containing protein n=1 Tax=Prymnesium parvum TaxID=97485 RepID=A0AB34IL27_PRYPA
MSVRPSLPSSADSEAATPAAAPETPSHVKAKLLRALEAAIRQHSKLAADDSERRSAAAAAATAHAMLAMVRHAQEDLMMTTLARSYGTAGASLEAIDAAFLAAAADAQVDVRSTRSNLASLVVLAKSNLICHPEGGGGVSSAPSRSAEEGAALPVDALCAECADLLHACAARLHCALYLLTHASLRLHGFSWQAHLDNPLVYYFHPDEIRLREAIRVLYGAPKRRAIFVALNVYHVSRGSALVKGLNTLSRDLLRLPIGLFHSGVEVCGLEWSFGSSDEKCCGIFGSLPRLCPFHTYRETLFLGTIMSSDAEVFYTLLSLADDWQGNEYQLLHKNCNHFSQAFAARLGLRDCIPSWLFPQLS